MDEVVNSVDFTFHVNGQTFASSLPEPVGLSSKVHQSLDFDPSVRTLTIRDAAVDRSHFAEFRELVCGRDFVALAANTALLFLPLCQSLRNEHLVLDLFVSLFSPSDQAALTCYDANSDDCAPQFHTDSVDALRLRNK
jgi:hypothetical protein